MKVGDRVYCKVRVLNLTKDRAYHITAIFNDNDVLRHNNDLVVSVTNDMGGTSYTSYYTIREVLGYSFKKVFYTEQEIRKLKLERLNEKSYK